VAEQRYQAVLAVISDGLSVSQVAEKVGVSRQTLHSWLARYEAQGLEAGESVASAGVVSASNAGGGGSCAVGVAPVAAVCLVSRVATRCGGQPTRDLSRSVYNFYRACCGSTNSEGQRLKDERGRHPEAQ